MRDIAKAGHLGFILVGLLVFRALWRDIHQKRHAAAGFNCTKSFDSNVTRSDSAHALRKGWLSYFSFSCNVFTYVLVLVTANN